MQHLSERIRELVVALDTAKVQEEQDAWTQLKPLGDAVLPHFLEAFPRMRKWQGRASLVFHSIPYARTHDDAVTLALTALSDKATVVRYRACMLLAYSLRKGVLSELEKLLHHSDKKTAEDAAAAIDAIKHQNHNFFVDRQHSGRLHWKVESPE